MAGRNRLKICFVSPEAYGAMAGREGGPPFGGAEAQQAHLARELARRGHAVSMVTLDHGQPEGEILDGVRILRCFRGGAGLPGVRFFHPRLSGLWGAMKRADAQVYYQRMAEATTGIVGIFCRLHRRRFLFALANDDYCVRPLPHRMGLKSRWFYTQGLRLADRILVQTRHQQTLLRRHFGLEGVVIGNGFPDPGARERLDTGRARRSDPKGDRSLRVGWVGRFSPEKRLEWLLEAARRCPKARFEIVGDGSATDGYAQRLRAEAASLPNVRLYGWVSPRRMHEVYQRIDALCCTSPVEGFPNTFPEAWAYGLPVLTTFDPDGVVAREGLGWSVEDVEGLAVAVREAADGEARRRCGRRARTYYLKCHDIRSIVDALELQMDAVLGASAEKKGALTPRNHVENLKSTRKASS